MFEFIKNLLTPNPIVMELKDVEVDNEKILTIQEIKDLFIKEYYAKMILPLNENLIIPDIIFGGKFFLQTPVIPQTDEGITFFGLEKFTDLEKPSTVDTYFLEGSPLESVYRIGIPCDHLNYMTKAKFKLYFDALVPQLINNFYSSRQIEPFATHVGRNHCELDFTTLFRIFESDTNEITVGKKIQMYELRLFSDTMMLKDMVILNEDEFKKILEANGV